MKASWAQVPEKAALARPTIVSHTEGNGSQEKTWKKKDKKKNKDLSIQCSTKIA
jgi:hypothetical protein